MPVLIKTKRHFFTRFPLGLLFIFLFSFSPVLIGLIGAWITEYTSGEPCHEGNCGWMVLPWLGMFTLPAGAILFIAFMILVFIDGLQLIKKVDG